MHRWIVAGLMLAVSSCAFAGSNSWTPLGPEGGVVRDIAIDPRDPNTAVAIAWSGVYRTTNGGALWTRSAQSFQNPPYELVVDPSDPSRLYVFSASNARIVASADGGITFQPFATAPVANAFEPRLGLGTGGVMYYTAGLRVFRSENRGSNWTEVAAIVLPGNARILSIIVDPTDANTVYAIAGGDGPSVVFLSRNGGGTWVQQPGSTGLLVPHPSTSGEVWSSRTDGLWKSVDFGASWSHVQFTEPVFDVDLKVRGSALHVIAVTAFGVQRSTNGGASWSNLTGDLRGSFTSVATHAVDPDRIMVSGYNGIYVPGATSGTWVTRHSGIIATTVGGFDADPTTDRIYAMGSGIYSSTSAGGFFSVNNQQLESIGSAPLPKLVTAYDAQPGTLLALISDELARSVDGGETWSLVPGARLPYQQWRIRSADADPLNLIVAGTPNAYRSTNGGSTWTPITGGLPADFGAYDIAFAASNPSIVYLSPYVFGSTTPQTFGIYRSTDGGSNWVPANTGIESLGAFDIAVDPTNPQVVYAIAGETLVKSTDGGQSWRTLQHSLRYPARVSLDPTLPRIVYVTHGDNFVLRSVNGGESFQYLRDMSSMPFWNPGDLIVDPRRPNVILVGTSGFGAYQMSIEPDLTLTWGTAPTPPAAGATATYALFAANRGPYASSGARATIQIPADVSVVAATSQGGSCAVQTTNVVCTLDALALNGSIGITLSLKPQNALPWAVGASIQGDQPDPQLANNSAVLSVEIPTPGSPPTTPSQPSTPPAQASGGGGGGGGSVSLLFSIIALLLLTMRVRQLAH